MRRVTFSEVVHYCILEDDDAEAPVEHKHRCQRKLQPSPSRLALAAGLIMSCCLLLWTLNSGSDSSSSKEFQYRPFNAFTAPKSLLLPEAAERRQASAMAGIGPKQQKMLDPMPSLIDPMPSLAGHVKTKSLEGETAAPVETAPKEHATDGTKSTSLQGRYQQAVQDFTLHLAETYQHLYHILDDINDLIQNNVKSNGPRWVQPVLLPPLPDANNDTDKEYHAQMLEVQKMMAQSVEQDGSWFWTFRKKLPRMAWEDHYDELLAAGTDPGPEVDYTATDKYTFCPTQLEPPESGYPRLKTLQELFDQWPQDEDYPGPIHEELMLFDYSNPVELEATKKYIELELPFKLYNVPEVEEAGMKWTDEYLSQQFDGPQRDPAKLLGFPQESANNFFTFFTEWDLHTFGVPPVRNNDLPYEYFVKHANYADMARLPADQPHFYYQAGDYKQTRYTDENSFIGRDLPSFGSRDNTYFVFNVTGQWGIQCRMGERGTVAATHQDPGRNMVAMVTGAKRYVLSPPNQCSNLGIFPQPRSPLHRHSAINFGHLHHRNDPVASAGMSDKERAWLERASTSQAVETVLKAGEVLYIPSHWFHYIISVQKSAQCNCRSGIELEGRPEFGGRRDVITCGQDWGLTDVYAPDWVNEMKMEDKTNRDEGRTW